MEIGRHAEDVGDPQSSIQLLQMPWNNIPSKQTSRQTSLDPQGRPPSRDSMHSGGGGFRSSVSRGILEDMDFGPSSPAPRDETAKRFPTANGTSVWGYSNDEERLTRKWSYSRKSLVNFASEIGIIDFSDRRFLQQNLEDNDVESMSLQERFPPQTTGRLVLANALYHTCCNSSPYIYIY
jgi:hypothetical protein